MSGGARSPLEAALGRALAPAELDSIGDLNNIPESIVTEARALGSRSLARELIDFYAGLTNRPYLPAFIHDVIEGGVPARQWGRGDVLVPDPSLTEQLILPRDALLAPIGGYAGVRTIPELARWRSGDSATGAPARPRPDATYRSGAPKGSINLVAPSLEAAPGIEITLRRWIAARIARCLAVGQPPTIVGLRASLPSVPSAQEWTADARIACAALTRESIELVPNASEVPGFRGPDAWYLAGDPGC